MKTLRNSRFFIGGPISLVGLCLLEKRVFPVNVSDIVAGSEFEHHSGQLHAGDVDLTWEMKLWRNGFWSVKAELHDGGIIAGDFYSVIFAVDPDHRVGTRFEGSINVLDDRHKSHQADGVDTWVRDNWSIIYNKKPLVSLHSAVDVGQIVGVGFMMLAVAVSAVFFSDGKQKHIRRCDDTWGGGAARPDHQNEPCIEFYEDP